MNKQGVKQLARDFGSCVTIDELASFLKIPIFGLSFLSQNKIYNEFKVRKSNGGERLIEDPEPTLKALLSNLAEGFQAVHYLNRSKASFGFQWVLKNERMPRSIKTNAQQHLNKKYLVNLDFKDFFYQVDRERLMAVFKSKLFRFNESAIAIICDLVTHKGRLPMGAPSSPVLSNMAAHDLDLDLEKFCSDNQIVYTRFVDDLSFSSQVPIGDQEISTIQNLTKIHGFKFNESKKKVYGPDDTKLVTGIEVGETLMIPLEFLAKLEIEITKYSHTHEVNQVVGYKNKEYLEKIEDQLEGKLRYIEFILGENHEVYQRLSRKYLQASETHQFDNVSWLDFDYQKFIPPRK